MEEKEQKQIVAEDEAWQALQKVKKAEERARQMVEEARSKTSPDIIRKAAEEAEELKKRIVAEARNQAEIIKKEIVAQATAEAEEISRQTEAEKKEILKKAEANFNRAVENAAQKLVSLIESRKG